MIAVHVPAKIVVAMFLALAAPVTYIGHPAKVARTEQRRLEREYANPANLWYGAGVSVECTQTKNPLRDDCQATIDPPNTESGVWLDGTAHISRDGQHFHVVWN